MLIIWKGGSASWRWSDLRRRPHGSIYFCLQELMFSVWNSYFSIDLLYSTWWGQCVYVIYYRKRWSYLGQSRELLSVLLGFSLRFTRVLFFSHIRDFTLFNMSLLIVMAYSILFFYFIMIELWKLSLATCGDNLNLIIVIFSSSLLDLIILLIELWL